MTAEFRSTVGGQAVRQPLRLRPSRVPAGRPRVPAQAALDVVRDSGQPLAVPVKEEMEARLGADLADVRLEKDVLGRRVDRVRPGRDERKMVAIRGAALQEPEDLDQQQRVDLASEQLKELLEAHRRGSGPTSDGSPTAVKGLLSERDGRTAYNKTQELSSQPIASRKPGRRVTGDTGAAQDYRAREDVQGAIARIGGNALSAIRAGHTPSHSFLAAHPAHDWT